MRLLTWNIQWGRGCDERVDLERIAHVIRETADCDVICLQEVATSFLTLPGSRGEDQVALLSAAFPGYSAHYVAATDVPAPAAGVRAQFGNLILSRLPVLQVWRHLLPWPADPAVPSMQRACLEAVVHAPGGLLRVLTTHLEYYSVLQRTAQMEALRALQAEAVVHARHPRQGESGSPFAPMPRPATAVLCGDFNCEPEAAELARLQAPAAPNEPDWPAWRDAWPIANPGQAHAHTVGLHGAEWPDHPYCCDFVCVSTDLAPRVSAVRVNQATDASDHQPMLLELAAA